MTSLPDSPPSFEQLEAMNQEESHSQNYPLDVYSASTALNPNIPRHWLVHGLSITPSQTFTQCLNAHLASLRADDPTIRFTFSPSVQQSHPHHEIVHTSRLLFAQGPFAALPKHDFAERNTKTVLLCADDDAATFAVIRDFLYGLTIPFGEVELGCLLRVIRSAHRWQLIALMEVVCRFIAQHDWLSDSGKVVIAVDTMALPGLPEEFRDYFWESTGKFFVEFSQGTGCEKKNVREEVVHSMEGTETRQDVDEQEYFDDAPIQHKLCPCFPGMWDLALSHGALVKLIRDIRDPSDSSLNGDLLDLVMRYLEQRIDDDEQVLALIELLGPDSMRQNYLLSRALIDDTCSARAVRLLARSLLVPSRPRNEMRFVWEANLATINPDEQNFLYGSCVPHLRGQCSWDPNIFDACSAIHMNVTTVSNPGKEVLVSMSWDVGHCFPRRKTIVELRFEIREQVSVRERLFYQVTKDLDLAPGTGDFSAVVGWETFDTLNGVGASSAFEGIVSMMLDVRLIEN